MRSEREDDLRLRHQGACSVLRDSKVACYRWDVEGEKERVEIARGRIEAEAGEAKLEDEETLAAALQPHG